jgi:hypothetical protein
MKKNLYRQTWHSSATLCASFCISPHVYPTKSNRVYRLTLLFVGTTEKKPKFKIQGLIMVLAKKVLKYKGQIVFEEIAMFPFGNLVLSN